MQSWCPMQYRDFNDVPRMVLFNWKGERYLLDCPFDDAKDDYPDCYGVYLLDRNTAAPADWTGFSLDGKVLGQVRVTDIVFDETRREFIDASFLEGMT